MRASKVAVLGAALALAAAMSVVPLQVAGAQTPSTSVLVPSNGATVSGTGVVLDAGASAGVTEVQFELTGGSLSDSVVATATPTYYGWIAKWNSTTVADGTYTLQSVATEGTTSATSTGISIAVSNGVPSISIVLPSSGANLTGSQWLDALASAGVTQVHFEVTLSTVMRCPITGPPSSYCSVGNATPTYYGWLIDWNTTTVADGKYNLVATTSYPNGASNFALIQVTVGN